MFDFNILYRDGVEERIGLWNRTNSLGIATAILRAEQTLEIERIIRISAEVTSGDGVTYVNIETVPVLSDHNVREDPILDQFNGLLANNTILHFFVTSIFAFSTAYLFLKRKSAVVNPEIWPDLEE